MAKVGLTQKQRNFVMEYIKDFNATRSYTAAGFKANTDMIAGTEGHKLLKNPKVKAAIDEQIEARSVRQMINADNVLKRYWDIATANPADFYDPVYDDEGNLRFYKVKDLEKVSKYNMPIFKGFKTTKFGVDVEFHDQTKAMEMVAKHIGMFTDKVELAGKDGGNLKVVFDSSLGDGEDE